MTGIDDVLQQQEEGESTAPPETTETTNTTEEVEQSLDETKAPEEKAAPSSKGKGKIEVEEKIEEPSTVPDEPPAVPPDNTELNELRQFIRAQRKEIAAMQAKLSRVKETGEVDDEGNTTVTYTPLERLQMELHNVAVTRAPILEVLVEAMEANPKYTDIYEVCTKSNFDDIFEMAAASISRQEGRDFNEVLVQLELEVWKKANPYKYMYGIIKENHPKYKNIIAKEKEKPPTTIEEAIKPKTPETAKKVLEAKAAPGSIAAAGAGEKLGTGAWTAAKIDDLSEMELHQVPPEVYKKYMMGQLK